MPYMPTNISPNHVTISKDEDIIFHCLIDKSDTITGVKLTLYNYYDKNESAYLQLGCTDLDNSEQEISASGLTWDRYNSSHLPFQASNYDISVFSLGIQNNSTFFDKNIKTIGYKFEFTTKNDYSIFVLDGVFNTVNFFEDMVELEVPYSASINPSQQKIVNASGDKFSFSFTKAPFQEDTQITQIGSDTQFYLESTFEIPTNGFWTSSLVNNPSNLHMNFSDPFPEYSKAIHSYLTQNIPKITYGDYTLSLDKNEIKYSGDFYGKQINLIGETTINDERYANLSFELRFRASSYYIEMKLELFFDYRLSQISCTISQDYNYIKISDCLGTPKYVAIIDNIEYPVYFQTENSLKEMIFYTPMGHLKNIPLPISITIRSANMFLNADKNLAKKVVYEYINVPDNSPLNDFSYAWYSLSRRDMGGIWGTYHVLGLTQKQGESTELNLLEVNNHEYYTISHKFLGTLVKTENWKYGYAIMGTGPKYVFPSTLIYVNDSDRPPSPPEELCYTSAKVDLNNQNDFFQFFSNTLTTSEQVFNLVDTKPSIIIEQEISCKAYGRFIVILQENQQNNNIEYSQWTLKDSFTNEIIYQTPKEYFTIKDFKYYFFKPNKIYLLELKVHDKRNFDYSSQIEVNTEEENFEEVLLEESAKIQDKYVEINLKDTLSENVMDRIILRDELDNDGSIIKSILLKENVGSYNTYFRDYGAGQGKNYVYKIIVLSQPSEGSASGQIYKTNEINTNDWYEVNLFGTKSHYRNTENGQYEIDEKNLWSFELDADANNITFNASNTPNAESASRYPKVTTSQKNYLSGTGTAYLGSLNQNGEYCKDTDKYLMDFANFASNGCVKILKLKNGMVIPVSINLKSSQNFANLNGNPTKITFDWVQVDSLDSSVTKGGEE